MHRALLEILVDPISKTPLRLETDAAEIIEGILYSESSRTYPIIDGIPRFVVTEDPGQTQTGNSFGFMWAQHPEYQPGMQQFIQEWIVEHYGFGTVEAMRGYFDNKHYVLDAGCGNGQIAGMWLDPQREAGASQWVGFDISLGVDVARQRLGHIPNTHFVQGDILQPPFAPGSFDAIFSQGVLHHTPSTERALKSLGELLAPNGEILFYVYRKKAPIREFTDDYIRDVVAPLPPQEAWEMLRPLTKLAQALADLKTEVEVPEDIPYLGIKAGRYDVQRLIYWHVAKMFWNEDLTFEENNHLNFDWYHPRYAHRQTAEQIRQWCSEAKLDIKHFHEQESGYTVRAIKA